MPYHNNRLGRQSGGFYSTLQPQGPGDPETGTKYQQWWNAPNEEWSYTNLSDEEDFYTRQEGLWGYEGTLADYMQSPGAQTLQDPQASAEEYWQSLEEGIESDYGTYPGGWAENIQWFTPFEEAYGEQVEFLKSQAGGDILDVQSIYDLQMGAALGQWEGFQEWEWDQKVLGETQAQDFHDLQLLGYQTDYENIASMYNLAQTDLERLEIAENAMWDIQKGSYEDELIANEERFQLIADNLTQQGIDARELWRLRKEDLDQLGIDTKDIWDIEKASLLRQKTEATGMWGLTEDEYKRQKLQEIYLAGLSEEELIRLGDEATSMWGFQSEALEKQWGLEAGALTEGYRLATEDIERMELDAAETWGLSQADIERRRGEAGELWFLKEQDIMRRGLDAQAIWGFEEADLREVFATEKEALDLRTQAAIREAQKGLSNATISMGFASAPTGLENLLGDVRTEYGITEAAGREALGRGIAKGELGLEQVYAGLEQESLISREVLEQEYAALGQERIAGEAGLNQYYDELDQQRKEAALEFNSQLTIGEAALLDKLNIGSEQLVQTQAGLESDLKMNAAELTDTLERLSAALDISEAEYDNELLALADKVDIGADELEDKIAQYGRDKTFGDTKLLQDLEALKNEGLIDDAQLAGLQANINTNIDIGAANLSNVLANLTHDQATILAQRNIDDAAVLHKINEGTMTLEHALETGQFTYDKAMAAGLLDYTQAQDASLAQYDIGIGDEYDDLQGDIWGLVWKWQAEQEEILRNIIETGDAPRRTGN